ncbi:hypothetical protein ACTXT7_015889 [Hymenolepis weldensis]
MKKPQTLGTEVKQQPKFVSVEDEGKRITHLNNLPWVKIEKLSRRFLYFEMILVIPFSEYHVSFVDADPVSAKIRYNLFKKLVDNFCNRKFRKPVQKYLNVCLRSLA